MPGHLTRTLPEIPRLQGQPHCRHEQGKAQGGWRACPIHPASSELGLNSWYQSNSCSVESACPCSAPCTETQIKDQGCTAPSSQWQTLRDAPHRDLKRKQSKQHTHRLPTPTSAVRTLPLCGSKHSSKARGSECGSCALGPAKSAVLGGGVTERCTSGPGRGGGGSERRRAGERGPGTEPRAQAHLEKDDGYKSRP